MDDATPPSSPDHSGDDLHDIRTTFTVIMGNVQLMERRVKAGREVSPDQLLASLALIRQHVASAHEWVRTHHQTSGKRPEE